MPRYFIQVAYKGARYAGFQIQDNANSVQAEVEKALKVFFKADFELTCSSRTDAGVHALSNYFHFDSDILPGNEKLARSVYNLNAILPGDIIVKSIVPVSPQVHCRFDALYREYDYYIYQSKDPFSLDRAYYYPFALDIDRLEHAASIITEYTDFTTFSKRNTQVKTFNCSILKSTWINKDGLYIYSVRSNRFLRGMVRGLVGTMLKAGAGKITIEHFKQIIEGRNCALADFSVPPQGLFLKEVAYLSDIYL
ncbi:MAG: tRNA pseudouridine(38-40) synthase TruA [Chitinophagaceae bacterium]|nr:tRNA pseudouridine(38-40) synthase TruA [Chitinophagaceae bacterium]